MLSRPLASGLGRTVLNLVAGGLVLASATGSAVEAPLRRPRIKNLIVMVSDGCGWNTFTAGSYYEYGRTGAQPYEDTRMGWRGYSMATHSAWNQYDPELNQLYFTYCDTEPTDSASAATAMSTGYKTYDAAIGVDIFGGPLTHLAEIAELQGKATGVVTSVEFSHATPAGFVAHNVSRNNYAALAQEMILASATDVIIGCGNPDYDDNGMPAAKNAQYVGGSELWTALKGGPFTAVAIGGVLRTIADADRDGALDPWTLMQDKAAFEALAAGGAAPKRLLGVPKAYTTLQQARSAKVDVDGDGDRDANDAKEEPVGTSALNSDVPGLATLSRAALNVLDDNPNGLFLMIEGGAVDWAGHANQRGRIVEEQVDFNAAVKAVIDWVNAKSNWGETLVIITADHETGHVENVANRGQGVQPDLQFFSGNHTNQLVPIYARGGFAALFGRAADRVDPERGAYLDNTDIAKIGFYLLGCGSTIPVR